MGSSVCPHLGFCVPKLVCIGGNEQTDKRLGYGVDTILREFPICIRGSKSYWPFAADKAFSFSEEEPEYSSRRLRVVCM